MLVESSRGQNLVAVNNTRVHRYVFPELIIYGGNSFGAGGARNATLTGNLLSIPEGANATGR